MDYEGPDEAGYDFMSSAGDSTDSWSDADDYLLNDIGVAMRLQQERP